MDVRKQIEKQIEKPDWDKIESLAKSKQELFKGIVSANGALLIAAKELYPDFNASQAKRSGDEIKCRLISKTKLRFVDTKAMKQNPVKDVYLATEDAGVLSAQLWGKTRVELFTKVEHNDAIIIKDARIGERNGEAVLNFYDSTEVEKVDDKDVKPIAEMVEPIDMNAVKNSKVGSLSGLVIQAVKTEYLACPECGKAVSEVDNTFHCESHREVSPVKRERTEITVDAGDGVVFSTMLWPEQMNEPIAELSLIKTICRVYDSNFYAREKARKSSEVSEEVLNKQFPRNLRVTVYSYELEGAKQATDTGAKDEPVPVESIEDAA